MIQAAWEYFRAQDIVMVETPALSTSAVSDPHIESVSVALKDAPRPYYLHTSPEYGMKRLLAAGFPDIAQICRVFRDGEAGRLHQPEFTLIEWYRRDFGLHDMMLDTESFIRALVGERCTTSIRLSYREAFQRHAKIDPIEAELEDIIKTANVDTDLEKSLGRRRDDWLDFLMATRVAAALPSDTLTTIYHYPASQAALSRISSEDERLADRFEVFFGAVELANGYVELTDYREQADRFAHDQVIRSEKGLEQRPLDTALVASLRAGLPDCAGVAVGLERLLMIAMGATDIRDVLHFPIGTTL